MKIEIPGFYYDPVLKRYFKGKAPAKKAVKIEDTKHDCLSTVIRRNEMLDKSYCRGRNNSYQSRNVFTVNLRVEELVHHQFNRILFWSKDDEFIIVTDCNVEKYRIHFGQNRRLEIIDSWRIPFMINAFHIMNRQTRVHSLIINKQDQVCQLMKDALIREFVNMDSTYIDAAGLYGEYLVYWSEGGVMRIKSGSQVFHRSRKRAPRTINNSHVVKSLIVDMNGLFVVNAFRNGLIEIFDIISKETVSILQSNSPFAIIEMIHFKRDERHYLAFSQISYNAITVIDITDAKSPIIFPLLGHIRENDSETFSVNEFGSILFAGGSDGVLRIWDLLSGSLISCKSICTDTISNVQYKNNKLLVSTTDSIHLVKI